MSDNGICQALDDSHLYALSWKENVLSKIFSQWICSIGSTDNSSGDGLAINRQQAITWTNDKLQPGSLHISHQTSLSEHIDSWVQDCSISSALAMETLQSWTKPSIFKFRHFQEEKAGVTRKIKVKDIWAICWANNNSNILGPPLQTLKAF